jgi:uncharacterized membrane protein YgcG
MNNDAEVSIKFKNSITGENKLKQYAETLQKIQSVLSSMEQGKIKQMEQSAKQMGNVSTEADKMAKKVNIAFNYGALRMFASSLSRVYSGLIKVTQKSSEFLESFNLFQVAFEGNYQEAERFINKLSEMYGLDEAWLTRTVGLFKQLANAMGLSGEAGTKLSMLLTQMSIDLSSLYNIDTANVPPILQSALAGQTKPARRLGSDITQTTLQTTLDSLGIEREVVNLSYAEKRLLIVISLTQQLAKANNDWGRTLESPANQMRILSEQFARLTREVGNVFLPILAKILPYLNAIVMVMTEIIGMIARLFGYKKEDYDYFNGLGEYIDDVAGGLDEANEGVEKLKRGLRGFDKLNNITTPSASASGVGAGAGGISTDLMDAFNQAYDDYFKTIEKVEMKATRIRDRIMEWLGFQKMIDDETGDVYFKFKKITGGTILGALGVGGTLYGGLRAIFKILSKITGIKFSSITTLVKNLGKIPSLLTAINPKVAIIIAIVATLTAAFVKLYKTNDEFRQKVDKLVKLFKEDFLRVLGDIKDLLEPFLASVWKILKQIWNEVIKPLGQILMEVLEPIFTAIVDVLTAFWENVFRPMYPVLKWIVEIALKAISTLLKTIVDIISDIVSVIKWLWDHLVSYIFNFVVDSIKQKVIPAIQSIGNVINTIKNAIQKVVDWWNNLWFNKKKISVEYETKGGGGGGSSGSGGSMGGRAANGGIFVNGKMLPVNYFDKGGLPPIGQMFVARENGPELVGNIGSHTAVMNNDQIVSSVAYGVEGAVSRAMRNANQGKQIYNIYLDQDHKIGTYTLEQLQEMAKSNGKPLNIY